MVAPSVLLASKARRPPVEKQRDGQDEIPEHALIVRAQERCQVSNRTKIGLDGAPLAPRTAAFSIFRSARDFASTVSLSARLLRLVCRRSSSAARSFDRGALRPPQRGSGTDANLPRGLRGR